MKSECRFNDAVYKYMKYCYQNYQCRPYTMYQTLVSKVFQLSSIASSLASQVADSIPSLTDTPQSVEAYASEIGIDIGKILRLANNYSN